MVPDLRNLLGAFCLLWAATTPSFGQTITPVGDDLTFDVASWNIEMLRVADPQMSNAVATMHQAGIDLWGVQEITSRSVFNTMLDRLGDGWDGHVSASTGSGNLFTAFFFREDVVRVRRVRNILTPTFDFQFAGRPPLVMDVDVTLADTTVQVTLITLHMKCCSNLPSFQRRQAAAVALKNSLDTFNGSDRIIVLGDFNDETDRSITFGQASPYAPFVSDPNYRFLIADGNVGTWCGNDSTCRTGSTIDNILISNELDESLVSGSAARYASLLTELPGYVSSTSDHLPVHARFSFATSTGVDSDFPEAPALSVWPNPAGTYANITAGPTAQVTIYDLLGRAVYVEQHRSGSNHVLDVSRLTPGLYIVRVLEHDRPQTVFLPVTR